MIWWVVEPTLAPWTDEVFTTLTARRGIVGAFSHALHYQSQPPVYYVSAAAAWQLEPTVRSLRFVSLLGAIACVWSMIPLARALRLGTRASWLPVMCASLPLVQTYALEARPYSWAMTFVSCAMASMLWLLAEERRAQAHRASAVLVASAVLAMLTFYYAGLPIAFGLVSAWLLFPSRRRRVMVVVVATTLCMLPWLPIILVQLRAIAGNYPVLVAALPTATPLTSLAAVLAHGIVGAPIAERSVFRIVAGGCTLAAVATAVVRLRTRRWSSSTPAHDESVFAARAAAVILSASVGSVAVLLALQLSSTLMVWPRYYVMVAAVGMAAFTAIVAATTSSAARRLATLCLIAVLAGQQISFLRNLPHRPDPRPGATYVAVRATPDERVFVANFVVALLFLQAYHGQSTVVPLPVDTSSVRYRMRDLYVEDTGAVRARIDSSLNVVPGFWWVRDTGLYQGVPAVDSVLRARAGAFSVVLDTLIPPLHLTHFTRAKSTRTP